jgi:hypothetical protein
MKAKLIGMVHLKSMFGSDNFTSLSDVIEQGIKDVHALQDGGIEAIMLENDGDQPYFEFLPLPQAVCFAMVAQELVKHIKVPFGYTVLLNDWQTALSLAKLTGADFIRLDTYVDQVERINDGIVLSPDPTKIQAFRKRIGAEHIKIYTDVQVKHTKMVDGTKTLEQSITEAIAAGSDGVIITGSWTGTEAKIADLQLAQQVVAKRVPVIVGSGVNSTNVVEMMRYSDMAIIGTSIKDGEVVSQAKVAELMQSYTSSVR